MPAPAVAAILVAEASGNGLEEALASVGSQSYDNLRLVVVCVGELAVPPVAARLRAVAVSMPAGIGFAAAVNEAHRAAIAEGPLRDAGYLLLLHDDVRLDSGAVAALVSAAELDPSVAAAGAKLLEVDPPDVLQEVGSAIDRFGRRRSSVEAREVDQGQYDSQTDVVFCSDACLLVRRESFEAHGGLDPEAWPYYEDVDLCFRMRAAGARVIVAPDARAVHAAALSRGLRRDGTWPADELRTQLVRGRLRLMLKNFQPLSLALLLPQLAAAAAVGLVTSVLRRELWRVRAGVAGTARVLAELPAIAEARRRGLPRRVGDAEILSLATRQSAPVRRLARVATAGRASDLLLRAERRALVVLRDPVAWTAAAAAVVVALTLRRVLLGGDFVLGEVRPPPALSAALRAYLSRERLEGFDRHAFQSPAIVMLGLLRSIPVVGAAGAEKLMLIGPLAMAAIAARRLGALLGLGARGRGLLAVAAAVNPVTADLLRHGEAGALVTWAASFWIASATLAPPVDPPAGASALRYRARWLLGWAAVAALHAPALIWLIALGAAISIACGSDSFSPARRLRLASGALAAIVLNIPWSLEWFGRSSPPLAGLAGFLADTHRGFTLARLGGGAELLPYVLALPVALALVRPARLAASIGGLLAVAWAAGAVGLLPRATALACVAWCVFLLVAAAARSARDELGRAALGWRQLAAIVAGAGMLAGWVGGAVVSVARGASAQSLGIVAPAGGARGRVLWLGSQADRTSVRATSGFGFVARDWEPAPGPSGRFVRRSLAAARGSRTHRLGSLLALADVSEVVALTPRAAQGLSEQADLHLADRQGEVRIYANDSWRGEALLLGSVPRRGFLTGPGLASLAATSEHADVARTGTAMSVSVPVDTRARFVYLADGSRWGYRIGSSRARTSAAGVWARVDPGEVASVSAPGQWRRFGFPMQAALAGALLVVWLAGSWLAGAKRRRGLATPAVVGAAGGRWPALAAGAGVAGAVALAWFAPAAAGAGRPLSSAWYCPAAGDGATQKIAIVNPGSSASDVLVRPSIVADPSSRNHIEGSSRVTLDADAKAGAVVEAYPGGVGVASIVSAEGQDAATCASAGISTSYFPEGGRNAAGDPGPVRTAYVLSNPFGELARVSFRFFTPKETVSPPALKDVRVAPGSTVTIDPESQLEPMSSLGAEITVWRGRAVVARRLRRAGVTSWTLGSPPVSDGIAPRASTKGARTTVFAINPTDRPGRVSIAMTGETGSLPQLSFDVEQNGRESFAIPPDAAGANDLIASVSSDPASGIEVIVVPEGRTGTSILPLVRPSRTWVIPVAEGRVLLLTNPGRERARVRISRLGEGAPIPDLVLPPGKVLSTPVQGDTPFGLLIRASGPVTAAAVGLPGTLIGAPGDR
jgi:GT2 family glycosyltransferase